MLTKDTGIIDAVQNHPEILEVLQNTASAALAAWHPTLKASARALLPTALMLTLSLPTATKLLKLQKNKTAA